MKLKVDRAVLKQNLNLIPISTIHAAWIVEIGIDLCDSKNLTEIDFAAD